MKDKTKLAAFYASILGLFTILLCTESSIWFSASIAMICTLTGVFVGQLIKNKKKFHISTDKLWALSGLFLLAIVLSLCFYSYCDSNQNKKTYILLINLILASSSILYLWITKKKQ